MESRRSRPKDIMLPRTGTERMSALLRGGHATKELIGRLKKIDTTYMFPDGVQRDVSLDDVERYLTSETAFYTRYYPPNARYKKSIETSRRQASKMKQLFDARKHTPLIKMMMDLAIKHWEIADRRDEKAKKWSPEEVASLAKAREMNAAGEVEADRLEKETGQPQEHGFEPRLLEIGGDHARKESVLLLCYAATLAKGIK